MAITTINIESLSGEQAIYIPEAMRILDDKVYLKKIGNSIFIIPFHNPWQNLIESTEAFTEDFMERRNEDKQQIRETFD